MCIRSWHLACCTGSGGCSSSDCPVRWGPGYWPGTPAEASALMSMHFGGGEAAVADGLAGGAADGRCLAVVSVEAAGKADDLVAGGGDDAA